MRTDYDDHSIGSFKLTDITGEARISMFPEASDIAISHQVYLKPGDRGKGIGSKQHLERLKWCKQNGFEVVLCTVNESNVPQLWILAKHKWRLIHKCASGVLLYMKDLREIEP